MYLLTFIISTMSIILLFRLFYIQIVKGPFLAEAAFMQKTGPLVDKQEEAYMTQRENP